MRAPRLTAFWISPVRASHDRRRIVAPKHDAVGMGEIRRPDIVSVREAAGVVLVPVADLRPINRIGAAVGADEALDPGNRIRDVGAARRGHRERDLLRPVVGADRAHALRDLSQRLVPADRLPARISGAFRLRAPHRLHDAIGVIDEFRRCPPFGAQLIASGMRRQRLDAEQSPVRRPRLRSRTASDTACRRRRYASARVPPRARSHRI